MDQNLPLAGNLTEVYLSEILQHLQSIRATGSLSLERDNQVKSIHLKEGQIVFASSNLEQDRLGEMLLKAGKLSSEQYHKSVEVLKATGKRQGAVLVELGFLTPKELFEGLKYQVLEILYSLFLWTEGRYRFITGELPKHVIPLEIELLTLLTETIKRIEQDKTA
jgi:hypothetical protein